MDDECYCTDECCCTDECTCDDDNTSPIVSAQGTDWTLLIFVGMMLTFGLAIMLILSHTH